MNQTKQKSPGLAALLSFLIPGLGQIYGGEAFFGIALFAINFIQAWVFMHVGSFFLPVVIINSIMITTISTVDAYYSVKNSNKINQ